MDRRIIYIESYYGGSHRQMVDLLQQEFGGDLYTLPSSKWNWRMRISALHFSETIPKDKEYDVLFASSVLNLCELVALRPDLAKLYKLYYFHENQLVYPIRKHQDRDFQHGYNQILSCLVADRVIFNSHYNMDSFLNTIQSFLSIIPDYRPKKLYERIAPKCSVLYFPVQMLLNHVKYEALETKTDKSTSSSEDTHEQSSREEQSSRGDTHEQSSNEEQSSREDTHEQSSREDTHERSSREDTHVDTVEQLPKTEEKVLHILWPHRWEHDKCPEEFCSVLLKLMDEHFLFMVSVLGSHTNDIPVCLQKLFPVLGNRLLHKGCLPQHEYEEVLSTADVVVSTAKHEFFGVAMLEAVFYGCYPLCPNRLVYPEIYPSECLYNTEHQLYKRLKYFCQRPTCARDTNIISMIPSERFSWNYLNILYQQLSK